MLKALRERCLRGAYRWGARRFLHSGCEWVDALPNVDVQQGRVLALVVANKVLASYIRGKYSSSEVKMINVDSQAPGLRAGEQPFDLIIMGPFLQELHEQRRAELFALVSMVARPGARLLLAAITEPETHLQRKVYAWAHREAAAPHLLTAGSWRHELTSHGLRNVRYKGEVATGFFKVTIVQATTPGETINLRRRR